MICNPFWGYTDFSLIYGTYLASYTSLLFFILHCCWNVKTYKAGIFFLALNVILEQEAKRFFFPVMCLLEMWNLYLYHHY